MPGYIIILTADHNWVKPYSLIKIQIVAIKDPDILQSTDMYICVHGNIIQLIAIYIECKYTLVAESHAPFPLYWRLKIGCITVELVHLGGYKATAYTIIGI